MKSENLKLIFKECFDWLKISEELYRTLVLYFDFEVGLEVLANYYNLEMKDLLKELEEYEPKYLDFLLESLKIPIPLTLNDLVAIQAKVNLLTANLANSDLKEKLDYINDKKSSSLLEALTLAGYKTIDSKTVLAILKRYERKKKQEKEKLKNFVTDLNV